MVPTLAQYSEMGLPFDLEASPQLAAPGLATAGIIELVAAGSLRAVVRAR